MKLSKEFHNRILRRIYYHAVIDKKLLSKKNKKRIYLFGTPEHLNYGDIAIFVAEMNFFQKNLPNFEVITIPERLVIQKIFKVKELIDTDDIIALHGGGNMGDVWPFPDMIRQDVIRTFGTKYRIISFPQSVSYSTNFWTDEAYQTLKNCEDISIFARDKISLDIMKKVFPSNVKCFLVPDIVLSLRKDTKLSAAYDVLFLMRKDREKSNSPFYKNVFNYIDKKYKYKMSDTVGDTWYKINSKTASKRLGHKLRELQKAKLVITDRLHGMIFAYITGTPAVVFDNNNHKIKNLYNTWFLGKADSIFFVNDNTSKNEIIGFINNVMSGNIKPERISLDYSILIKEFLA